MFQKHREELNTHSAYWYLLFLVSYMQLNQLLPAVTNVWYCQIKFSILFYLFQLRYQKCLDAHPQTTKGGLPGKVFVHVLVALASCCLPCGCIYFSTSFVVCPCGCIYFSTTVVALQLSLFITPDLLYKSVLVFYIKFLVVVTLFLPSCKVTWVLAHTAARVPLTKKPCCTIRVHIINFSLESDNSWPCHTLFRRKQSILFDPVADIRSIQSVIFDHVADIRWIVCNIWPSYWL